MIGRYTGSSGGTTSKYGLCTKLSRGSASGYGHCADDSDGPTSKYGLCTKLSHGSASGYGHCADDSGSSASGQELCAERSAGSASGHAAGTEAGLQMLPVQEGFLLTGIPAIERIITSDCPWAAVDEIGYLESGCEAYCRALERLMECKSVLAVLRRQDTAFLEALRTREDVFLYDLDAPLPTLGCVLMASGESRRFGGNKLLAPFHGKPLIGQMLAVTDSPLFSERIVVTRHPEVAGLCRQHDVRVLLHDLPWRSDTIRLGLDALTHCAPQPPGSTDTGDTGCSRNISSVSPPYPEVPSLSGCMFCPCDQPLLTLETVEAMAAAFIGQPGYVYRASYKGLPGSPIIFPESFFPALRNLPQGKGGSYLLKREESASEDDAHAQIFSARMPGESKTPTPVRLVEAASAWELKDIDTQEDLCALRLFTQQPRSQDPLCSSAEEY